MTDLRDATSRAVAALRAHGPMTRAELARRTGLPKSTVSGVTAALLANGTLEETGAAAAPVRPGDPRAGRGRGRPGTLLTLDARRGEVVGVEFGASHVRARVVDAGHGQGPGAVRRLPLAYGAGDALDATLDLVRELTARPGAAPLLGVGLALALGLGTYRPPVPTRPRGMRQGWEDLDLPAALADALGVPVVADNDANCAARAELLWGAARPYEDLVLVKLHAGVGGAVVIDRQVQTGRRGGAGEFGHVPVDPRGPLCRCGGRGCLEVYAGVPAVLAALAVQHGRLPTPREVLEGAAAGDPACRRALRDAGEATGQVAAWLCNALNPQAIVLTGALAGAGELLAGPVRESVARTALPLNADVDVVIGTLGRDAGPLGAGALALASVPV
ncbi:ROK family transcriptional regulator [Georgenia satyanarayanai]|uniref:ROK family transcriptional regulator n=1 Tax=Georgenia satyanarayanai TaxID=860221 RepID=UPI0015E88EB9|nr:ROK family transcriptional regulator [Georgenia satyanarayanai]